LQVVLEVLERRLDFDELDVELPRGAARSFADKI
jgi:hypothetical protein